MPNKKEYVKPLCVSATPVKVEQGFSLSGQHDPTNTTNKPKFPYVPWGLGKDR